MYTIRKNSVLLLGHGHQSFNIPISGQLIDRYLYRFNEYLLPTITMIPKFKDMRSKLNNYNQIFFEVPVK